MSRLTTLADAVVTALNAAGPTWSVAFTAERTYLPRFRVEDLSTTPKVSVVTSAKRGDLESRAGDSLDEFDIDVGIHAKAGTGVAEVDLYADLLEEIVDYFKTQVIAGHVFTSWEYKASWSPDQMKDGVFFGFVTLTFKAWG